MMFITSWLVLIALAEKHLSQFTDYSPGSLLSHRTVQICEGHLLLVLPALKTSSMI